MNGITFEKWYPAGLGVGMFAVLSLWATTFSDATLHDQIRLVPLYAALFDWSAIQTAFVFSIYALLSGTSYGFVEKLRNTRAMNQFIQYIKIAVFLGFALTLVTIPLIISGPEQFQPYDKRFFWVSVSISLFVWAFFAFFRVAWIFFKIAATDESPKIKG